MVGFPQVPPARTRRLTIIAQDPAVLSAPGRILRAQAVVPAEDLLDGPWGHRVQVIDYDATTNTLFEPLPGGAYARNGDGSFSDPFADAPDEVLLGSPQFHAQNVYAIVMRTLARFEQALGRRVSWGFRGHQLKLAPHAFADANAFYTPQDQAIVFGYFAARDGATIFSSLSHDVVVHEATHALVDGLRPRYLGPSSPDQAAFHEGFADLIAILSVVSLREVVEAVLVSSRLGRAVRRHGGRRRVGAATGRGSLVALAALTPEALKRSVLLGLAEQMGSALSGVRGRPLRRSATLAASRDLLWQPELEEPHRRGEVLVAAVLDTLVDVWAARLATLRRYGASLNLERVAEEGCAAADYLLTMAIRALDYAPPVHMEFGDFLSALLTADHEIRPEDAPYGYRARLLANFARFGIAPASAGAAGAPGLWTPADPRQLSYERTHFESMLRDPDEVFAFVWENRRSLHFFDDAYTRVLSVRPCLRIAPDGFPLRETVAEVLQVLELTAAELGDVGITKPVGMPDAMAITLHGGMTLIFDEYGHLKFDVHNSVADGPRQSRRLAYLWKSGYYSGGDEAPHFFAELHRRRAVSTPAWQEEW